MGLLQTRDCNYIMNSNELQVTSIIRQLSPYTRISLSITKALYKTPVIFDLQIEGNQLKYVTTSLSTTPRHRLDQSSGRNLVQSGW